MVSRVFHEGEKHEMNLQDHDFLPERGSPKVNSDDDDVVIAIVVVVLCWQSWKLLSL